MNGPNILLSRGSRVRLPTGAHQENQPLTPTEHTPNGGPKSGSAVTLPTRRLPPVVTGNHGARDAAFSAHLRGLTGAGREELERVFRSRTWPELGGCVLWRGGKVSGKPGAHGVFDYGGPRCRIGAHRAAWILRHGPIPAFEVVRHFWCGNPLCVRADHLALGSHEENAADRIIDGTQSSGIFNQQRGTAPHPYRTLVGALVAQLTWGAR